MDFNQNTLEDLIKEFSSIDRIQLSDIPNIDLYMDQVTTFFDDKLGPWKLNEEDKILTKTMINNYTKADILFPPIKKKYSKEHMVLLILIYHLKHVLSLNDIHTLLSPIMKKTMSKNSKNSSELYSLYEQFLTIQEKELKTFEENFSMKVNSLFEKIDLDKNDASDLLLITIINLIVGSSIQKAFAEKLIHNFSDAFITEK